MYQQNKTKRENILYVLRFKHRNVKNTQLADVKDYLIRNNTH